MGLKFHGSARIDECRCHYFCSRTSVDWSAIDELIALGWEYDGGVIMQKHIVSLIRCELKIYKQVVEKDANPDRRFQDVIKAFKSHVGYTPH